MLVQQILSSKGDRAVVTVKPGTSVAEAAQILSSHRIGALVVSTDGTKVLGILSERDIVRALGQHGASCMAETVEALMTRDVVGCAADDTADQVLDQMTQGRFRHMPVTAGGKMIGFISIGDVVKARLSELSMEKAALTGMIMGI